MTEQITSFLMRLFRWAAGALARGARGYLMWLAWDTAPMQHARHELLLMDRKQGGDEYTTLVMGATLQMVALFSSQHHSGYSASIARQLLQRLLAFEPIGHLTGEDDEWGESALVPGTAQNRRCARVFKDGLGDPYDREGYLFVEPSGSGFTSRQSRRPLTLPGPLPARIELQVPKDADEDEQRAAIARYETRETVGA